MEGLIDNAKKFMASEEGQKMQSTFQQQGGADIDQFLGQGRGSSGENVLSNDTNNDSYRSQGDAGNQYTEQNQTRERSDRDDSSASSGTRGQRGDTGVVGDASKAEARERDNDYSGYSGEDCELKFLIGLYFSAKSAHRLMDNQLGADKPASGEGGQGQGRTDDNDNNYDGARGASGFDASGTSTPAYRQEDDYEDGNRGGKTQGGGSYGTRMETTLPRWTSTTRCTNSTTRNKVKSGMV
ncbi:hypothetical protein QFC22_000925 [Naganishia vaughanmartiniae]|uniref:Uncharacterized protein n=1 Tax=Naganishia vaughanmartiniae TaxID=1424756 RepID=A0ACC2XL15_9TREE|nr:hypothetical protein QFC22_000925 [Naganishia vaughanmartiniae]